jgi:hypothetical protein
MKQRSVSTNNIVYPIIFVPINSPSASGVSINITMVPVHEKSFNSKQVSMARNYLHKKPPVAFVEILHPSSSLFLFIK